MGVIDLFPLCRDIINANKTKKRRIVSELFEKGRDVAEDYYQLLKECEIKTRDINAEPTDIIHEIELRRETLHVRRQEARAMLQITYWERDEAYKQFIYGISMILCGDNAEMYMEMADCNYGRCGHTLLDIIDRYEGMKIYCNNDRGLIIAL